MEKHHVLLIEDEPNIAEAIRFILKRAGWEVSIRSDGAQALSAVEDLRPDVLILDLMLPGLSGIEILSRLRARSDFADLPVLMLTARGQSRDREAAQRAGATAFLSKPFANSELCEMLGRIVAPETTPDA
ncbi:response regulator transcription factor [Pseudothioclava arenosa]|uniref:Two-component system response regulator n=1 Tax=Pseudothioclava arenosa TaxID=1795308 RepID=A0A2A4CSN3_9RHOB|nr:response regulator [Pseudothioclava arenosa]PCD77159.1 two-component system response regulator [Pseudothioclava arenosa]